MFNQQIIFLPTLDLTTTTHFYETRLGLLLTRAQTDCHIYQVSPAGYLGFCQRAEPLLDPARVIITLVTQEVDDWHARLQARGLVFETAPTLNPRYNIYHCFLRDPNGYRLEIQRFNEPL